MDDETKPLRSALLKVPAWREQYIRDIKAIAEAMAWSNTGPFIERERELIKDAVAKDTRKLSSTESFLRETATEPRGALREYLEKRSAYLLNWARQQQQTQQQQTQQQQQQPKPPPASSHASHDPL